MVVDNWSPLSLGDVVTLQRGFDLPTRLRKQGEIPIVSSSGITDTHNHSPISGPGVVTGRYGTIGEVFYIENDYWPLNTTLFVSDFKGNCPLFIYFLLKTIDYKTYSGKSGVPGVNRNDLHEIPVKLPPIEEQRSIAQALSDVDAVIAALDKAIAKKRAIKTATMQQLLTGKKRLPGFGKGKGYKESAIGEIPEDWEAKRLKRISPAQSVGLVINPSSYFDDDGSVPMLVGSQIHENHINWESAKRISKLSNDSLPASRLIAGDLVTVRVGEPGVTAVVPPELDGCNCASMMIVRQHLSFSSLWLCYVMNSPIGKSQIEHVQYGTAQKQFNISDAVNFLYPVPPFNEQQAIATVLSDMDAEIAALETRLAKTQALKQGMMQALLTGRVRLV
jgi:type I restriction enzyme S subunit